MFIVTQVSLINNKIKRAYYKTGDFMEIVNDMAILNLYLYLANDINPLKNESFYDIILKLYYNFKRNIPKSWTKRCITRLEIILNYIERNKNLASSKLIQQVCDDSGLCTCAFLMPKGEVYVAFRGTGTGEWLDNGEGLSGIANEEGFATEQQTEALNWFAKLLNEENIMPEDVIVSGHSKGGNKAQLIAMKFPVQKCISFDGQGFSPELLGELKAEHEESFYKRRAKVFSYSAENDYINVLGARLMPYENVFYLKSNGGFHFLEAVLNKDGTLTQICEQGRLSECVERISDELMKIPAGARKYATLGVMNIIQKYIVNEPALNGDFVSLESTIAGLGVAAFSVIKSIVKDGKM